MYLKIYLETAILNTARLYISLLTISNNLFSEEELSIETLLMFSTSAGSFFIIWSTLFNLIILHRYLI